MMEKIQIKLKTNSVLTVPLHTYENDFLFIVNGTEFKTSRIIAHLLSPKICKIQESDPIISEFSINTEYSGNFQTILDLVNFQENSFPESDLPFIKEISQILGNESLLISAENDDDKITIDSAFNKIIYHEKYPLIYSQKVDEEIDFISSHFYEIEQQHKEKLYKLTIETIERILNNTNLQLKSEDQLISIVNDFYLNDSKYSVLYGFIEFSNVSENRISEFLSNFNYDDINIEIWRMLSKRLQSSVFNNEKSDENPTEKFNRYHNSDENSIPRQSLISIPCQIPNTLKGIITYLKSNSEGGISNEIEITSSSVNNNIGPESVIQYDDKTRGFETRSERNAWICFDFKKHRVIPKNYTIRSWNWSMYGSHPKNWVIEGSNDNKEFEILDEQTNNTILRGSCITYTFTINNPNDKKYRFLRMRLTDVNCANSYYLSINSIEFNGSLIL